jgi:signal peptidase I
VIAWQPAVSEPEARHVAGLPPFDVETKPSAAQIVRELPALVLLAVLVAFCIKTFVAQAFFIPSASMVPQLEIHDRVVVSKLSYDLHHVRRGDIIVFDRPPDFPGQVQVPAHLNAVERFVRAVLRGVGVVQPSTDEFIKRVIALPGEVVDIHDDHVFINGHELIEPYLPPGTVTQLTSARVRLPLRVPAGEVWVMGDNRANSADSRVFGPVRESTIVGRAILRVWPFSRIAFL